MPPMDERRTYWLSFADGDRPRGQQFLGVAVVDVTEADCDRAVPFVVRRRPPGSPPPEDEVLWVGAAITKAHETGCNPGGEVGSLRIDDHPDFAVRGPRYPRFQLLSRADLDALDPL